MFGVDLPWGTGHLGEIEITHLMGTKDDHSSPLALLYKLGGMYAEAGREHAVIGDWAAPTLQVAQNRDPGLDFQALCDRFSEDLTCTSSSHSAWTWMSEFTQGWGESGASTFGDDDDGEETTILSSCEDLLAEDIWVVGHLGNRDTVGPACHTRVQGDPSSGASHDLQDHDSVMGFSGGMKSVNGIGCCLDRGPETKAEVGGGQVIVDGLGDTDHRNPMGRHQSMSDSLRPVSTDHDQAPESQFTDLSSQLQRSIAGLRGALDPLEGISPVGGSENGSSAMKKSLAAPRSELVDPLWGVQEAIECILAADHIPSLEPDAILDDCANDRVEAGRISASGENAYAKSVHGAILSVTWVGWRQGV
jgi:hypothetical protein